MANLADDLILPFLGTQPVHLSRALDDGVVEARTHLTLTPGRPPQPVVFRFYVNDDLGQVQISVAVLLVPAARRPAVARLVAEELAGQTFVSFWLTESSVQLNLNLLLSQAADPTASLDFGYRRVLAALLAAYPRLEAVAYPPLRRSRIPRGTVERQIDDILRRLDG